MTYQTPEEFAAARNIPLPTVKYWMTMGMLDFDMQPHTITVTRKIYRKMIPHSATIPDKKKVV